MEFLMQPIRLLEYNQFLCVPSEFFLRVTNFYVFRVIFFLRVTNFYVFRVILIVHPDMDLTFCRFRYAVHAERGD